jgi:hypothetical protein
MNNQILQETNNLKQFIELYKHCKDASHISKVSNEEKRVFSLKTGLPIRFGCSKKLIDYIPEREALYDFWRDNKYFWIIPLEILPSKVYGFILRGYEKSYNVFRITNNLPVLFGLYDFKDFEFGSSTPILLTEGVKDALVLKTLYPYTLSLNTAGLTVNSIQVVSSLSNEFILLYDNDKPGREAAERDMSTLKDLNCKVQNIIPVYKDVGKYINNPTQLKILYSTIKQYF